MLSRFQRLFPAISVLLAWCVVAGLFPLCCQAAPEEQGTVLQEFSVPAKASAADVALALRFVARNREWFIEQEEPGYLRISLKSRGTALTLGLHYDATKLTMRALSRSDDSKSDRAKRWINNLSQDIRLQFAAKR